MQVVNRNFGLRDFRLRAVAAIFRAQSALGVHQEIELHRVAPELMPNAIAGRDEIEQFDIGRLQHAECFLARQQFARQRTFGQRVPAAVGRSGTRGGKLTRERNR